MLLARTTQLAVLTLLLALPAAVLEAQVRVAFIEQTRDVLPSFLAQSLLRTVVLFALASVAWVVLFRLARARLGEVPSARIATLLAFLPPLLLLALRVNGRLLRNQSGPASLLWNGVMLVIGAAVLLTLASHLRRWQAGSWVAGKPQLLALGVLLLAPLGVYLAGPGKARDPEPDILVILLDVLRADHLGCYGYERATSPNIDALAADSVLFENLISASTYTKTSVASLFTGLAAYHHGVYSGTHGGGSQGVESDLLSERFTTLAEACYDLGLNTSAWVENGHVRDYLGYAQGFTFYADQPGDVEVITDQYLRWKDEWGDVARSFTYLHILDIHGPYDPPPPFLGMFGEVPEQPLEALTSSDSEVWSEFKRRVRSGEQKLSRQDLEELELRYDELIAYVDHSVGRIVDDLKATGRYDNTLIMVLSDHGEAFWEHGFLGHSTIPHDELTHVPMIIKLPNSAGAGRRVGDLLGHIDIWPTLIEFVGAEPHPGLDGESFLSLLQDSEVELEPRTRFTEIHGMVGVRTARWNYISTTSVEPRLFDLSVDPEEQEDCLAQHPEIAAKLQAAVDFAREERTKGKAERVVLDADTVESLRALGYL